MSPAWAPMPLVRVRLLSWAGALALAALIAALFAMQRFAAAPSDLGGLGAPSIEATLFARPAAAPESRPAPPPQAEYLKSAALAQSQSGGAQGAAPRLWNYGAQGEFVFTDAEQLQRCRDARRAGQDAPDCPSAHERAPLVLHEAGSVPQIKIEALPLSYRAQRRAREGG